MMAILSYLQIFVSMFTSVILFFFPHIVTYKTVALIIAFISVVSLAYLLLSGTIGWRKVLISLFICVPIVGAYYITSTDYTISNEMYNSFMLVLSGQIAPSVLCAVAVSDMKSAQERMMKLAPIIGLIFSIIAFFAAFFPTGTTSGGFIANENSLNYQSTSYLAAYATGLNLYYLICYRNLKFSGPLRSKIIYNSFFVLIIINLLTILISGGRGGFALFIVQIMFAGWIVLKFKSEQINAAKVILTITISLIIGVSAINYALSYEDSANGFKRIIDTVLNHDTNGRNELIESSLKILDESPIFGHGIGSVFFKIGVYSHNCITDALVETGYIGCIIFLGLILLTFYRCFQLIKIDIDNSLWTVILLNGVIMSLFSGYYLAHIPIYWVMAYIFSRNNVEYNVCDN